MCVCIIDRNFVRAAGWSIAAAILSLSGLLHAFKFTTGDTLVDLPLLDLLAGNFKGNITELFPASRFAMAYLLVALILLAAHFFTKPNQEEA